MTASIDEIRSVYERRHAAYCRTFARLAGSVAAGHDIVQETFARALRYRGSYAGPSLEAWLWGIGVRLLADERRRPSVVPLPAEDVLGAPDPGWPRGPLGAAVRTLPERQRVMVFLFYYADLSYAEIAAACDVEVGTVGSSLAAARARLLAVLGGTEVRDG